MRRVSTADESRRQPVGCRRDHRLAENRALDKKPKRNDDNRCTRQHDQALRQNGCPAELNRISTK